ncbi:HAD family hydrolase [Lacticaseibacillus absianus]|uniref:HAD family hydrolase n=1 Tax=Lacticaseibacillus absianus TaxID=2729623 RepID=UPI0015C82843|nr:HAD family hydrolase [Lacticaseibacillus absianus]
MSTYAIFMDVDGTLVDHTQIPTVATKAAIAKYRQAGHQFFIASGRPLFSAREMADRVSPGLNVIGANGSVTQIDGTIDACHFTADALSQMYAASHRLQLPTYFFTQERVLYLDALPTHMTQDGSNRIAGQDPAHYLRIDSAEALLAHQAEITNGIAIEPLDAEKLAAARAAYTTITDIDTSSSAPDNIEITAHGVNKATAIRRVCAQLKIPLDHTMAFGDGNNDLQMLTTVRYGVAMGNANATVKAAVDYHTRDIHHDGVAAFLHQFFGDQA